MTGIIGYLPTIYRENATILVDLWYNIIQTIFAKPLQCGDISNKGEHGTRIAM